MKFSEAIESFFKFSSVHHSEGTKIYNRSREKVLLEHFGNKRPEDITSDHIQDFIISHRKRNPDISNSTINKMVAALKFIIKNQCNIEIQFRKLTEVEKVIPVIPKHIIRLVFRYYETSDKTP